MAEVISQKSKIAALYICFAFMFSSGLIFVATESGAFSEDLPTISTREITFPEPVAIPFRTIASPEELASAVAADKLILHFDVEWSVTAVMSRPVISRLRDALDADPAYRDVVFCRVDCTEQHGALWDALGDWLSEQREYTHLMGSGNGGLAWVRAGKLVGHVDCAFAEGIDKLVAKTGTHLASTTKGEELIDDEP